MDYYKGIIYSEKDKKKADSDYEKKRIDFDYEKK